MAEEEVNNRSHEMDWDKWKRCAEWIHGICVVQFDLELGQAMEMIYPKHVTLSEKEKMNVCYSAFPDSNSGCMGNTKFHIMLRAHLDDKSPVDVHQRKIIKQYNKMCPEPIKRALDSGHLYGFVFFRQIKNARLPRGYFQKSIVILTRLPFVNLFSKLLNLIAPNYFQQKTEADQHAFLENIFSQIAAWPSVLDLVTCPPCPSTNKIVTNTCLLRILDRLFTINIVDLNKANSSEENDRVVTEVDLNVEIERIWTLRAMEHLFLNLGSLYKEIHLIWELVLTNEPIITIANSPTICSQVVLSLSSLISPLMYCGELRPYFTIHDTEFKEFTQLFSEPSVRPSSASSPSPQIEPSATSQRKNCILGVTNPFFIKTLKDWPHTIQLQSQGDEYSHSSAHLKTNHKRFLQKDKDFIKEIQKGIKVQRPEIVQSLLMKTHMLSLTQSFLIPLERFLASLMPLKRSINPFKLDPPQPKEFNESDFLQTIEVHGPSLTTNLKGDWSGLYKKFFKSENFKFWLELRLQEMKKQLQFLQLEALADIDIKSWSLGKMEVELVDLILKLKHKLIFLQTEFLFDQNDNLSEATKAISLDDKLNDSNREEQPVDPKSRYNILKLKLETQLNTLKTLLPDDLKNIL